MKHIPEQKKKVFGKIPIDSSASVASQRWSPYPLARVVSKDLRNPGIILEETRNTSGTKEIAPSIAKMISRADDLCEHAASVVFIAAIT